MTHDGNNVTSYRLCIYFWRQHYWLDFHILHNNHGLTVNTKIHLIWWLDQDFVTAFTHLYFPIHTTESYREYVFFTEGPINNIHVLFVIDFDMDEPKHRYILLGVGLVSLVLSFIASLFSIYTILWTRRKTDGPLEKRKLAERIIFYMALSDFTYSISRIVDFIYNIVLSDFPPNTFCVPVGAMVTSLVFIQSLLVVMMCLNALLMTVYERALSFGRYDVGLFVILVGGTVIVIAIGAPFGAFGPDKAW